MVSSTGHTFLQMVRAVGENTFQPKIGFKTRYGVAQTHSQLLMQMLSGSNDNTYYRQYKSQALCNHKKDTVNLKGEFRTPFFIPK